MRLTKEQLEILSQWETNFDTAIRAEWALNPGTSAMETINNIWNAATGEGRRLNPGCSTCIFNLLMDMGQLYFDSKLELEAKAVATGKAKVVEVSDKPAKPVKKVTVSTQQREKKKKERKKKE